MHLSKLFRSPRSYLYILLVGIGSCLLGMVLPGKWLLPLLNALGIYPLYFFYLKEGKHRRALNQMLIWAGIMSITIIILTGFFPELMQSKILRGQQYRDEMFQWIQTGVGEESTPYQFIPKQLLHYLLFCGLTIVTGGFAALFFGAVLLNYMNFYVGSLFLHTSNPELLCLFAWQPWAIIRVIGYIITAVGLSEFFFSYIFNRPQRIDIIRKYCFWGISCILLDLVLKTLLAPTWQKVLHRIIVGI